MTIARASVEEGARLAAEATPGEWLAEPHDWSDGSCRIVCGDKDDNGFAHHSEANAAFIAHWNPEFAAELARELQRLWRVEEDWQRRGEEIVTTRLAAAILIGTLAAKQPGVLEWARVESVKQPEATGAMTRQLVADVQRFDEGKAGSLADEIHVALANPAAEAGE